MRRKVLFKVNGVVKCEETTDTSIDKIESLKWLISQECECGYHEIEVEVLEASKDYSKIDVTKEGLIYWDETRIHIIDGVECFLDEKSEDYVNAVIDGNFDDYLVFI